MLISWGFYLLDIRHLHEKSLMVKITKEYLNQRKALMMKISYKIMTLSLLFMLSGCFGSYYEPEPVGVGKGVNELKLSPCACMHIDLPKNLPDWYIETI